MYLSGSEIEMKKLWLILFCLIAACDQQPKNPIVGHWLEIMPENHHIVQGISFNGDGTAQSIGMATLKYESWKLDNNQLTLSGKSIGNGQTIDFSDTYEVMQISPESLKLNKPGQYQVEYRKVSELPEDVE